MPLTELESLSTIKSNKHYREQLHKEFPFLKLLENNNETSLDRALAAAKSYGSLP